MPWGEQNLFLHRAAQRALSMLENESSQVIQATGISIGLFSQMSKLVQNHLIIYLFLPNFDITLCAHEDI